MVLLQLFVTAAIFTRLVLHGVLPTMLSGFCCLAPQPLTSDHVYKYSDKISVNIIDFWPYVEYSF